MTILLVMDRILCFLSCCFDNLDCKLQCDVAGFVVVMCGDGFNWEIRDAICSSWVLIPQKNGEKSWIIIVKLIE